MNENYQRGWHDKQAIISFLKVANPSSLRPLNLLLLEITRYQYHNSLLESDDMSFIVTLLGKIIRDNLPQDSIAGYLGEGTYAVIIPYLPSGHGTIWAKKVNKIFQEQNLEGYFGRSIPQLTLNFAVQSAPPCSPERLLPMTYAALIDQKDQTATLANVISNLRSTCINEELISQLLSLKSPRLALLTDKNQQTTALLTKYYNYNTNRAELLQQAALMQDIGLCLMKTATLNQAPPLRMEQMHSLQQHPQYSAQITQNCGGSGELCRIILDHHRTADGHGFPLQKAGEAPAIDAQIVGIAAAYNELLLLGEDGGELSPKRIMAEIDSWAGHRFNRDLVADFQQCVAASLN